MTNHLPDTNVGNIEYIRKQDALDAFGLSEKTRKYGGDHSGYDTRMLYEIQDTIESLEPTDIVQVVRCDDCVYYGSRRWCELHSSVFDDNAFCSYGERREE